MNLYNGCGKTLLNQKKRWQRWSGLSVPVLWATCEWFPEWVYIERVNWTKVAFHPTEFLTVNLFENISKLLSRRTEISQNIARRYHVEEASLKLPRRCAGGGHILRFCSRYMSPRNDYEDNTFNYNFYSPSWPPPSRIWGWVGDIAAPLTGLSVLYVFTTFFCHL